MVFRVPRACCGGVRRLLHAVPAQHGDKQDAPPRALLYFFIRAFARRWNDETSSRNTLQSEDSDEKTECCKLRRHRLLLASSLLLLGDVR